MMLRRRRKLVLAVVSPIVAVAALELAARVYVGDDLSLAALTAVPMQSCVVPDAQLGWRGRPSFDVWAVGPTLELPMFSYRVTTNSRGFRDRERDVEPAAGTTRIACLGDSFPWGWGVPRKDAYPAVLQELLGDTFEVLNFGVPGYATDQALLLLENEARLHRPDLVALCLVLNDVEGNLSPSLYGFEKPRFVAGEAGELELVPHDPPAPPARLRPGWLERSALARIVDSATSREPADAAHLRREGLPANWQALARSQEWTVYSQAEIELLVGRIDDPASVTHRLLARVAALCGEIGAELLVFSVAHHHDPHLYFETPAMPPAARRAYERGTEYVSPLARAVASAGETAGFETLSVDDAMLRAVLDGGANLNVGDGHLTAAGHRLVAEELAAWVAERFP